VLFYDDVITYQDLTDQVKCLNQARHIFTNYLEPNSPFEVNLQRPPIEVVRKKIKEHEENLTIVELQPTLFDTLQKACVGNLMDSYNRFYYTKPFQDYIKSEACLSRMKSGATVEAVDETSRTKSIRKSIKILFSST
jgi:hypothetical protein